MQMSLALVHLAALELHRHVLDPEEPHGIVNVLENVLMPVRLPHDRVYTHGDEAGRHRPDMQVVDGFDTGNRFELRANGAERDVRWRRFEQNVDGFSDQPPGTAQDEQRHQQRRDRIRGEPACPTHDDRRRDGADGPEQIAQHMQVRRTHVEARRA